MVLKCEPVFSAIEEVQRPGCRRIYLTPDGVPLSPAMAEELSRQQHLVLLSGHYEGIDQRIRDHCIDQEISIGDYVLTNGTLAALNKKTGKEEWRTAGIGNCWATPALVDVPDGIYRFVAAGGDPEPGHHRWCSFP